MVPKSRVDFYESYIIIVGKCIASNCGDRIRDINACKSAVLKGAITDFCDCLRDNNTLDISSFFKCAIWDLG